MPVYNNPRQAIIVEGGGSGISELLTVLVGLAAAAMVVGSLVLFIAAHIVLLACCVAGTGVVMGVFLAWCRWVSSPARLRAARSAELAASQPAVTGVPARAIPASTRALPAPVHYHLHFHGASPEDAVVIARGQAARPAIKETPWPSSPSSSSS